VSVSLVIDYLRGLRENSKHKIQTIMMRIMLQLAEINRPPIVIPTPAPSSLDSILKEEEFWLALTKVLQGYLGTVCRIEVRVALLCAQQYVP
jgi:hypothetical protein